MLKTVRQRLIFSYLAVAVASAIAVGAVALALVSAYNARAEREYLRANAYRIAGNIGPMLNYPDHPVVREHLVAAAHFYGFLGQVRVTIKSADGHLLADSGSPPLANSIAFFAPGLGAGGADPNVPPNASYPAVKGPPVGMVVLPANEASAMELPPDPWPGPWPDQSQPDMAPEVVQVTMNPWGGFAFTDQPPADTARSPEVVSVPILPAGNERVNGYVELSEGPAYGTAILESVRWALLGGVLAGALLAVVAGVYTARQVTQPLDALGRAAERMAAGDLKARAPHSGPLGADDEFGRLAAQFNQMAGQLDGSFAALAADREALRRFVADAAHELRTPLTAAMTFNELLLDGADPANVRQVEFLRAGYAQLERLGRTVRSLLDLSLLDAGAARITPAPGDLRAVAERALAGILPLALERGLSVESALPDAAAASTSDGSVPARFDETYLRQALDNLLANAVKFTPSGGTVTLGAALRDGTAQVWVSDTGPGIAPEDLPHIFERFYRGHGTAPGTLRAEGSGLGLAIAHSIVAAHGGTLSVESRSGQGARFTITLPT